MGYSIRLMRRSHHRLSIAKWCAERQQHAVAWCRKSQAKQPCVLGLGVSQWWATTCTTQMARLPPLSAALQWKTA